MINNRVAFMSAMALAVLSLFLVGGSEASLNSGDYEPSDSTRLDPSAGISFSVVLNANGDNDEGITSIYEASFIHDDIFIRVDLMHKTKNGWNIYEVKSSSSIKSYHEYDASIQWHVLKQRQLMLDL